MSTDTTTTPAPQAASFEQLDTCLIGASSDFILSCQKQKLTLDQAVAARHHASGAMVYASWNGATKVASWTVLAGRSSGSVSPVRSARKRGFETAISVPSKGPFFSVEARDAKGRRLATSPVTKLS